MSDEAVKLKRRIKNVEDAVLILSQIAQSHDENFDDWRAWRRENEEWKRDMEARLHVVQEITAENADGLRQLRKETAQVREENAREFGRVREENAREFDRVREENTREFNRLRALVEENTKSIGALSLMVKQLLERE